MTNQDWNKVKQFKLKGQKGKAEQQLLYVLLMTFERRREPPNFLRCWTKIKKVERWATLDIQQILGIFLEARELVFKIPEDAPVWGLDEVEIVENYIPTLGKVEEKSLDDVVKEGDDSKLFNF